MTPDDAFGLGTSETPAGEDPLASIAYEEPEAPEETPVEEPAEAAPDEPDETDAAFDEEVQPDTEGDAPEPLEDEAIEAEPEGTPYLGRYGEKYKTVEAFEEAHRNALDLQQRQAERARQVETENRQLVEYLRLAGEYIEQQQKAPAKPDDDALAKEAEEMGVDPETLKLARQIASQEAQASVEPLQRQIEEQQRQAYVLQAQQATSAEIARFREAHAAELDTESEQGMVDVFNEFGLDPTVSDNYAIALEAARNTQLRTVLRLHPNYIDSDEGMEYARRLSGVHTVTNERSDLAAARKRATVEGGNSGGMPVGDDAPVEKDGWDQVLDLAKKERTGNVFGVAAK
jgi:hypothetical protein